MPPKIPNRPRTIEVIARDFGLAHAAEANYKAEKERLREEFLQNIAFTDTELARQTIYYEGNDPKGHVATLYPKWRLIKEELIDARTPEWRLILEEDPQYKSYTLVNPLDKKIYSRTAKESAPGIDLERMKEEDPDLYESVTFLPEPVRELKPLSELDQKQHEKLVNYLQPPKLTQTMNSPREAKEEELEGIADT